MVFKATKLIMQEMDKEGIKYRIEEDEKYSLIRAGFGVKNGPSVQVQFVSTDNDNDVAIRLYGLLNDIAESKTNEVLKVINECNKKYRFVKFVLDKDRDVNIEYDFPLKSTDDSVGSGACEFFARIMNIADDCYPMFMKVIWN